jgi:hypothetical protein
MARIHTSSAVLMLVCYYSAAALTLSCSSGGDVGRGGEFGAGGMPGSGGSADPSGAAAVGGSGTGGSTIVTDDAGTSIVFGCNPPCADGLVCTAASRCLAEGACTENADCFLGTVCTGGTCEPGGECGAEEFEIEHVPPNLMTLLDRSCSMMDMLGGQRKWHVAVDALTALTTRSAGRVQWGFTVFPDRTGENCAQDPPLVLPGHGTEPAIEAILSASRDNSDGIVHPGDPCVTNTMATVQQTQTLPELHDSERRSYVVLISDGHTEAKCASRSSDNDLVTENTLAQMSKDGIKTFVLGFALSTWSATLDRFAVAGGVPNPDPGFEYYPAQDPSSLQLALDEIVGSIVGCDFRLTSLPPNPQDLYAFIENQPVPRDNPDGWSYDASSNVLNFTGASCTRLQAGMADVDIVFGCNQPTVK